MAKVLIEVTEKDIQNGVRGSCSLCPIARAVYRKVTTNRVHASGQGLSLEYSPFILWGPNHELTSASTA